MNWLKGIIFYLELLNFLLGILVLCLLLTFIFNLTIEDARNLGIKAMEDLVYGTHF